MQNMWESRFPIQTSWKQENKNKSNQIKSNQMTSNQIKSNQIKSNQTKPNKTNNKENWRRNADTDKESSEKCRYYKMNNNSNLL